MSTSSRRSFSEAAGRVVRIVSVAGMGGWDARIEAGWLNENQSHCRNSPRSGGKCQWFGQKISPSEKSGQINGLGVANASRLARSALADYLADHSPPYISQAFIAALMEIGE